MKNILYVLIGLMAGFVLAAVLLIVTRMSPGQPVTLEPAPTQAPIVIQIMGEVGETRCLLDAGRQPRAGRGGCRWWPIGGRGYGFAQPGRTPGGWTAGGNFFIRQRLDHATPTHSPFTVLTTLTPRSPQRRVPPWLISTLLRFSNWIPCRVSAL